MKSCKDCCFVINIIDITNDKLQAKRETSK